MNIELCQQRLSQWLDGLEMPSLEDPRRRLEELSLGQLRNFFVLLLATSPDAPPETPNEILAQVAPHLSAAELVRQTLTLPLQGSPDRVVTALDLGDPLGDLFELQERLTSSLSDDGHRIILSMARLF